VRTDWLEDPLTRADPAARQEGGGERVRLHHRAPGEGGRRPLPDVTQWSLRRLAAVSVALIMLCVLAASVVSAAQSTVYGARVEVLYEVTGTSQSGERQLATQRVLLGGRSLLGPVAAEHGVPLTELARATDVERIGGSEVMRITVEDEDPDLALLLAQSIADSYVATVTGGLTDTGLEEEQRLRDQIRDETLAAEAGRARLDQIAAARATPAPEAAPVPMSAEERELLSEDATRARRISELQAQLTQVMSDRWQTARVRVLTPAYLLESPVGPKPVRAAAAGAMAGLLLAAALMFLGLRGRTTLLAA
jgi:capsular polysaccharide biosynthesis protein